MESWGLVHETNSLSINAVITPRACMRKARGKVIGRVIVVVVVVVVDTKITESGGLGT